MLGLSKTVAAITIHNFVSVTQLLTQMPLKTAVSRAVPKKSLLTNFLVPPYLTTIEAEDVSANGTSIFVQQEFIFDRDEGSLRVHVDQHNGYEESVLKFNETTVSFL